MIGTRNYWGKDGSGSSPAGGSQALPVTVDLGVSFSTISGQSAQQPALRQPRSQPSNLPSHSPNAPRSSWPRALLQRKDATEPGTFRRVAQISIR